MPGNGQSERGLLEAVANSVTFQEYQKAFSDITGLPLVLQPVDTWQLPHQAAGEVGHFCALVTRHSQACAACLAVHQRLLESAARGAQRVSCPNGLCLMAAPLLLHERPIGFLETGQALCGRPTRAQFARVARQLAAQGLDVPRSKLQKAYFATQRITARQSEGFLRVLPLIAQHLTGQAEKLAAAQTSVEPPALARARQYIQGHYTTNLRLNQVARACKIGKFQLCRLFTRSSGVSFADYVSQLRINKAKDLLLNPNLRITEIALGVGFQSVTHFDRVFKRVLGQSPRKYRRRLLGA